VDSESSVRSVTPEGLNYLQMVQALSEECCTVTDERVFEIELVTRLLDNFGTLLSLLDRLASCYWGCQKGDHIIESLVGRCCSSSFSSLILIRHGYYDEALALARSVDEIANLLTLFASDQSSLYEWKARDKKARKKEFSPFNVRIKLEELNVPTPIGQEIYGYLSERATHVTPNTRPQVHNEDLKSMVGGVYQEPGARICLNHIALALGVAANAVVELIPIDQERREDIEHATHRLLASIFEKEPGEF
jgi:hypothetical protein